MSCLSSQPLSKPVSHIREVSEIFPRQFWNLTISFIPTARTFVKVMITPHSDQGNSPQSGFCSPSCLSILYTAREIFLYEIIYLSCLKLSSSSPLQPD